MRVCLIMAAVFAQKYITVSVFPTLHQVRLIGLFLDLLDGNSNCLVSAGERTITRSKQDRNVFTLLIANECQL